MTDNVIQEETDETKCACGCGETIPTGKTYARGHYSKHLKAIRKGKATPTDQTREEDNDDIKEEKPNVVSFVSIKTDINTDPVAWFETDQNELMSKVPVGVGIISGTPYYLVAASDGSLIPPQLIPGFRGVFTSMQMDEIIAYQTEQQEAEQKAAEEVAQNEKVAIQEVKAKPEEKPAEPIRVIVPPSPQDEKANAPEQKKKSSSFLGTIFKKKDKEPKKNESQEISNMLKKIQEGNAGKTTG